MTHSFEQDCKEKLLACAEAYAAQKNIKLTTLGRLVTNDSPFFARLRDDRGSFTVRKYDEVLQWFSRNWPNETEWPESVERPAVQEPAA